MQPTVQNPLLSLPPQTIDTEPLCSGRGKYHSDSGKKPRPLGSILWQPIVGLVDNPPQVPKDTGLWALASTLHTRNLRRLCEEGQFGLLWADLDANPKPLDVVASVLYQMFPGCDWELYTTHSATLINPKARILVPLCRLYDCKTWVAAQKVFHRRLEAQGIACDIAAQKPNQIFYLPNKGVWYDMRSSRNAGQKYVL